MKKIYALIALLLILAMLQGALFACNSNEKPTEAPTGAPTEAPTQKPTEKPIAGTKIELLGNISLLPHETLFASGSDVLEMQAKRSFAAIAVFIYRVCDVDNVTCS